MPGSVAVRHEERAVAEVVRLAAAGLDGPQLLRRVAHAVGRAVPFDAYCASTTDPATHLITHAVAEGLGPPAGGQGGERGNVFFDRIYFEESLDAIAAMLRARRPAATLAEATAGAPERSLRHRELLGPLGFAHEVRGVFTAGGLWGSMELSRRAGAPDFGPREVRLLARVAPHVGAGLKAAALRARAVAGGDGPAVPGVLTLAPDGRVLAHTAAAARWLADLEDLHPAWRDGAPPVPVRMVAGALRRALAPAGGGDPDVVPRVRVRGRSGRWLTLYASLTEAGPARPSETVVVIAPAPPDEVAWLDAAAYGLSGREAEVLELLARGRTTAQIAAALVISAHTVQRHVANVCEKVGVRSRRALLKRLFLDHLLPGLAGADPPEDAPDSA